MKVCVPTEEDKGMNSVAYGHFGSARFFVIYDTETGETGTIRNSNQHHAHGTCHPMAALGNMSVEAVIVGGIGKRAIEGLNSFGIRVYQSITGTVSENIQALRAGSLSEITPQNACGGRSHGANC